MYKSHISPEQEESAKRAETIELFLARGGKIQTVRQAASKHNKKPKARKGGTIDAQKLLDEATNAGLAEEAIAFLREQGIEVH